MKKICVVTATRAEYGLLKPLMELIRNSAKLELQVIATGAHLSSEFGYTYKQIEADGFPIDEKLEILLSSDTPAGIVKTMGLALNGMADILPRIAPDLLILLGDRYEMLAIASASMMFKIPIAHIHGGEITEGAYDDAIRHAITKMSHLHFTSTDEYKNRVIQMGENPDTVFNVGAIGLDNIKNLKLLTKTELETNLDIRFKTYNYQITFHPETLAQISSKEQFQVLLQAIDKQQDSFFVFTKANADADGRIINQMIDKYVAEHPDKSAAYASLGTLRFLSLVKFCTAIVGNSSSGILEAPSLGTPTINIGDRQRGRIQAASVVNVACEEKEILYGFEVIRMESFQANLGHIESPYDQGGAAEQIINVMESLPDLKAVKKFYNLI